MGSNWKVTNQRQTTINAGNAYIPAMIVSFVTEQGNAGAVTVAHYDYTPARVRDYVQQAADAVDLIGQMQTEGFQEGGFLSGGS